MRLHDGGCGVPGRVAGVGGGAGSWEGQGAGTVEQGRWSRGEGRGCGDGLTGAAGTAHFIRNRIKVCGRCRQLRVRVLALCVCVQMCVRVVCVCEHNQGSDRAMQDKCESLPATIFCEKGRSIEVTKANVLKQ